MKYKQYKLKYDNEYRAQYIADENNAIKLYKSVSGTGNKWRIWDHTTDIFTVDRLHTHFKHVVATGQHKTYSFEFTKEVKESDVFLILL